MAAELSGLGSKPRVGRYAKAGIVSKSLRGDARTVVSDAGHFAKIPVGDRAGGVAFATAYQGCSEQGAAAWSKRWLRNLLVA